MDWAEHGREVRLTALHRLSQGWVLAVSRQNPKGAIEGSQRSIRPAEVTSTSCREVEVVALGAPGIIQPRGVGNIEGRMLNTKLPGLQAQVRGDKRFACSTAWRLSPCPRESTICLLHGLKNQAQVQKDKRLHLPALLLRGVIKLYLQV